MGWLYKLLSKVLTNRFKKVLHSLVGETQAAFLGGRQILDGILIANELIDGWKRDGNQGLVLKLDFEKAYDRVNWNYLFTMLRRFGCSRKWVSWIKACVTSATMSILINRSPSSEFKMERGLRQGDSLSPLLFNIVAEGLNILFERAKIENVISGIKMGENGPAISHLQFADDTIIFCKNDRQQVQSIMDILCTFQLISGLKINFFKSQLCGIGIPDETVESYAEILGCIVVKLPIKYLRLPLGANPRRLSTWKPVIERFEKKLSSWNRMNMTLGGRLTMINSNLGNLPLYYMSLFKMRVSVARKLE